MLSSHNNVSDQNKFVNLYEIGFRKRKPGMFYNPCVDSCKGKFAGSVMGIYFE